MKSITYKTDLRYYYPIFTVGCLLLPFFGVGLLLLAYVYIRIVRSKFDVSDTHIVISSPSVKIKLEDISKVTVSNYRKLRHYSIADISINYSSGKIKLIGIKDALVLSDAIENILEHIKQQRSLELQLKYEPTNVDPGSLERLNDLVGLWQQGLISDADYEAERKKYS